MNLISLIVLIIVLGLLVYLCDLLPIPDPFKLVVRILIILVAIIYLLNFIGVATFPLR